MKVAWMILLVSAFTDFLIAAGSGLISAMLASGNEIPSRGVVLVSLVTGTMAGARTIQNALKNTPETTAALRGDPSVTTTRTASKTTGKTP